MNIISLIQLLMFTCSLIKWRIKDKNVKISLASLIVPLNLLQVVKLFQIYYNSLQQAGCGKQLVNRLVTICLQVCNICAFISALINVKRTCSYNYFTKHLKRHKMEGNELN